MPIKVHTIECNKSGQSILMYSDNSIFISTIPRSIEDQKKWQLV